MSDDKAKFVIDNNVYQLLFDTSKDPMWLIVNNNFEICNMAAVNVLGYSSKDELQSTHPSQLSPEMQPDGEVSFSKAERMMKIALDKGYNQFEWIHRKKNNEDFPVEVTLTKVSHNSKDAIYCVWRDISERKHREELLALSEQRAIDANKYKSDFLASISHDLRTPLNAILGFSEIMSLQTYGPINNKKYTSYIKDIHKSGTYLLNLINDLLDLSKIEAGKHILEKEYIDVQELALECFHLIKLAAVEKKITCIANIDADIAMLYADRLATKQIMMNLASNAVEFTPDGGTITLSSKVENNKHVISFKDTGVGITAIALKTITKPFTQANKDQFKSHTGTGLGLAIVNSLAKLHDGELIIESKVGHGTTASVYFPSSKR
jgi:PAS domain S-box-containing protein